MKLSDRLHCPNCKGRINALLTIVAHGFPSGSLRCTNCDWTGEVSAGIADLMNQTVLPASHPDRLNGLPPRDDTAPDDLLRRIQRAAGDHWPDNLGEVLELGCGNGQMTAALIPRLNQAVRGLIVTDTDLEMLSACRERLGLIGPTADVPVMFARISLRDDPLQDAIADTVVGVDALATVGDVRTFLTMVHRVLRPGGQAFFVAPNRRHHMALCHAVADAVVDKRARDGEWPSWTDDVLPPVAALRRQLVHQGDQAFLAGLRRKHLFDDDMLSDTAKEVGFATVDVVPIDPDPGGSASARQLVRTAGISPEHATELAALVASTGARYFSLLSPPDASSTMLLWLTKGIGPRARTFRATQGPASLVRGEGEIAPGGAPPRWSIEISARDSADGIVVSLNGWCLVNADVMWIRLKLDGVIRDAPVWCPRADVHEVLNGQRLYPVLNALCSGVEAELVFNDLHPQDDQCGLELEVVLANGTAAKESAPHVLVMNQPLVVIA